MENTKFSGCDRCCSLCCIYTTTSSFTADQTHTFILDKVIKCTDCIGTATYTGKYGIWKFSFFFEDLFFYFFRNNRLKITYDRRERMRRWTDSSTN